MSSAGWVFVWLLCICPFYEASEMKEKSAFIKSRQRRGVFDLNSMVTSVTGRSGTDFIGYGNYCGIGGSGDPVDPIDGCCQNHDQCYNIIQKGSCKEYGESSVYRLQYEWRLEDDAAVCEDHLSGHQCKLVLCMCDAILSNCLKSNMGFFNPENQNKDAIKAVEDFLSKRH